MLQCECIALEERLCMPGDDFGCLCIDEPRKVRKYTNILSYQFKYILSAIPISATVIPKSKLRSVQCSLEVFRTVNENRSAAKIIIFAEIL